MIRGESVGLILCQKLSAFYLFTKQQMLALTRLKAFTNEKIVVAKMIFVFDKLKKVVEKGENAGYQDFFPFPTFFFFQSSLFQGP